MPYALFSTSNGTATHRSGRFAFRFLFVCFWRWLIFNPVVVVGLAARGYCLGAKFYDASRYSDTWRGCCPLKSRARSSQRVTGAKRGERPQQSEAKRGVVGGGCCAPVRNNTFFYVQLCFYLLSSIPENVQQHSTGPGLGSSNFYMFFFCLKQKDTKPIHKQRKRN